MTLIKKVLIQFIKWVINGIPARNYNSVLYYFINAYAKKTNQILTYTIRPLTSTSIQSANTKSGTSNQAILIQGPIVQEHNFTGETINIYQKLFPGKKIILSTWSSKALDKINSTDIEIIINTEPPLNGYQNINRQIVSTISGLHCAQKMGKKFILKTRTDQRIYNKQTFHLFDNILRLFLMRDHFLQKHRLLATNLITVKKRPYGLSDMLMYGDISDMLKYWNRPLDNRTLPISKTSIKDHRSLSRLNLGETYFCSAYAKKIYGDLDYSLDQTYQLYANYFCIIDYQMVDLFWNKYDKYNENKYNYLDTDDEFQIIKFSEWLDLYFKYSLLKEVDVL